MESARTFIVCATILLCVWASPLPKPEEKSLEILSLMAQDPKVCKFPPLDVLNHPTKAPFIYPCHKPIPDSEEYGEGLDGLRTYLEMSEDKVPFLCMGFYDLSLQICKSTLNPASLVNDTKQFNNLFNDETKGSEFCKVLQPYVHSSSDSELTKDWVKVLNENLEEEDSCKSMCTHTKKSKVYVHPICKIILWGRVRLQQTEQSSSDGAVQGESAGVEELAPPQDKYTDTAYTSDSDLEMNDIVQNPAQQFSSEPIRGSEDIPPQPLSNDQLSPIKNVPSTPLTHMEMKTFPLPQQEQTLTNVKPDLIPNDNTTTNIVKNTEESVKDKSPTEILITPKVEQVSQNNVSVSPDAVKPEVVPSSPVVKTLETSSSVSSTSSPSSSSSLSSTISSTSDASILSDNLDIPGGDDKSFGTDDYADSGDPNINMENPNEAQYPKEDDDDDDVERIESNLGNNLPTMHNYMGQGDFTDAEDSHFFAYFLAMVVVFIVGYLVFHNKQKILALVLEGRRGGKGSRRRPSTSSYRKLDSNLEEAISSSTPRTNPHVIY